VESLNMFNFHSNYQGEENDNNGFNYEAYNSMNFIKSKIICTEEIFN